MTETLPLPAVALEQLLDGSPVPTFVVDADHVVTHWNKGCEVVLGVPAEAVVGTRDAWRAFYDAPRPVMADLIIAHGEEDEVTRFYPGKYRRSRSIPNAFEAEDFFPHLPGGGRWLFFTAAPLFDERGRIVGAIETLQDITERKKADLALQRLNASLEQQVAERTAALEEANRELRDMVAHLKQTQDELVRSQQAALCASQAKTDFLATMSHEIRTPLNGIIGMTDLLLDTPLSGEQRDLLGIVKSSSDGLISIINDILDFSKMEAGKLPLEEIAFDLGSMVGSVMKPLALRSEEKGLELICDIEDDVPARVIGDAGRIRQILINLLGNALKFTDRGEVELKVSAAPAGIRFAIRDTGIGIPPEKHALIFESFSQADTSTTRQYGGTGLGLTISSRLARLMQGSITLHSEVGRGSTFCLELPLLPVADAGPAGPVASRFDGRRVLVVDDNAVNRRILRDTLTQRGMQVDEEVSALSLLDHLAGRQDTAYDLLLVDYHMPGMDGFELIRQLRARRLFEGARILMLSSAAMQGQQERCRELGVAAYLTKPASRRDLLAALGRVLNGAGDAAAEPAGTPPEAPAPHTTSLAILVAEDNEVNQKLIRTLLEKWGHIVTLVGNGEEAVTQCRQQVFDLVLMDIQMPVLGGIEATRQIRALETRAADGQPLPIFALSAAVLPEVRQESAEAGITGYLTKPINRTELRQLLDTLHPAARDTGGRAHYDYADALRNGDSEIIAVIGELFLATCDQETAGLVAAAQEGNAALVERLAHTRKGLAQQFEAGPLAHLLAEVERLAHAGRIDTRLIDDSVVETAHFKRALAAHLQV